jgi:C4-dicarboxylate-binding protein DctP
MGATLAASWGRGAPAEEPKTFVMKLGSLTVNDEVHQWLKLFVAGVDSKAGGRIKGEIYTSGQLGNAARMIEGTQFGSIQVIAFPPDFFSGIDERFEVASAPGTFTSLDQVNRVVSDPAFHKAFLELGSNKGLLGIGLFPNAAVTVLTRKPVHHFDATPVAMSLGDVASALQQGAIDGALASIPAFTPLHFYDAAKYMTETGQYYVLIVAEMSKKWYATLPPDLQKIVLEEADRASHEIFAWQQDDIAKQRKTWLEHGGELNQLPPAEEAELMKRMSTIADDVGTRRPAIKEMYDQLKAAVQRNP